MQCVIDELNKFIASIRHLMTGTLIAGRIQDDKRMLYILSNQA